MSGKMYVSRRTMLRGLGAAVALPWLDAMQPTRGLAATQLLGTHAPRRMAFFFVPNGVNLAEWTPEREGYDYDLPSILQPLKRVKDDVSEVRENYECGIKVEDYDDVKEGDTFEIYQIKEVKRTLSSASGS